MGKTKKTETTETEVTAPIETKEVAVVLAKDGDSLADVAQERDAIYDRYLKKEEQELQLPVEVAPEKEEELKTATEEPKTEPVKKEDYIKTDVLIEPLKVDTLTGEQPKEKLVPYDALHEEREKRKSAQRRIKELEAFVEQTLREKEAEKAKHSPIVEDVDYIDPSVPKLREDINYLKQTILGRQKQEEQWAVEQRTIDLNNRIKDTDSELEKEGYPAFSIMVGNVHQRLQSLVAEDPDNVYLDNPQGWKKIYKEQIFPQIRSKVATSLHKQSISEKEELKAKAQLSNLSGKIGGDKEKEGSDEWTYDNYLSDRKKAQIY